MSFSVIKIKDARGNLYVCLKLLNKVNTIMILKFVNFNAKLFS